MNEERLKKIDRLTNLLREGANPASWKPEGTWRSTLEANIPGEHELIEEVIENARFARDDSSGDDNIGTVLISGFEEQDPVRIGRYAIQGRLGQGGMGVVYRAMFQGETFSDVRALKIIKPPPPGIDPELYRKRFKAEGEALGLLDHPNIVRIRDDGSEGGRPYLVMDLVPGAKHIDDYCDDNALPLGERLKLFHTLCLAVHFAHSNVPPVVHGDIKPSNVLISEAGTLHVVDFGLAKIFQESQAKDQGTTLIGRSPKFASPEQDRGELPTIASDIYSLGRVLLRLLENSPGIEDAKVRRRFSLDSLVMGAAWPNPAMRYKSAARFGELVLEAIGEAPKSNSTPRRPALARITRAIGSPSRHALIAAGAVATILIISFVWTQKDKEKQAAVPVTEQKKGGDSRQARSEDDRAKIVRENTAKLLAEILPSDSPLKQSLDPDAVTKELDTRAAQGDQQVQLALGLIRVYGHDRFVRNATLSGSHFVGEPKTPLQSLLKTSGSQADGKALGFYFSEEAAAAYREYFSQSGSMRGAAWLKDLASRGCVPAQAHWAQVLAGSPFRYQWAQNNEIGGIQKNAGEAFEWAQKAASGGHPRGHLILGNYYSTGIPGKLARDGISALKHWTIAAEQGLPQAQLSLAEYFEESVPKVPRDPVRSYMWANITVGTPTDSWDEMFHELMNWSMPGRSAMGIMSGMLGQPDPELPIVPREGLPRHLTDRKQAEAESMAREWRTRFLAANRKPPVPWHQMSCQ